MIWHTEDELLHEGRPPRREMFWVVVALPLLLTQASVTVYRLFSALSGEELLISGWFDISVSPASPWWHYAGGLLFHTVILLFLLALLWACGLQIQRWWFWRGRA